MQEQGECREFIIEKPPPFPFPPFPPPPPPRKYIFKKLVPGLFPGLFLPHPTPLGKYIFEKLVSGLFLGDVARRILATFAMDATLFAGCAWPDALWKEGTFPSSALSTVVEASGGGGGP